MTIREQFELYRDLGDELLLIVEAIQGTIGQVMGRSFFRIHDKDEDFFAPPNNRFPDVPFELVSDGIYIPYPYISAYGGDLAEYRYVKIPYRVIESSRVEHYLVALKKEKDDALAIANIKRDKENKERAIREDEDRDRREYERLSKKYGKTS